MNWSHCGIVEQRPGKERMQGYESVLGYFLLDVSPYVRSEERLKIEQSLKQIHEAREIKSEIQGPSDLRVGGSGTSRL